MVHPYLRRRNGEEAVTYPNDAVRGVLEKTLGVPLFQEQAMRLAVVAAGFTPGEADQLRRAMGAWRRPGVIDQFRRKLIEGMRANGFSEEYAEAVFGQIRGFGDYGFPESHAASFALLVYVSAWLKCHYPAAFAASLLNSQPMGFYAPAQLVRDARQHGVEVLPVDASFSDWDCTLEQAAIVGAKQPPQVSKYPSLQIPPSFALRLGFNVLSGVPSSDVERIVEARREESFRSMDDFARRTGLSRAAIARLAKAGVFESVELDRRNALWKALGQDQKELPLFDNSSIHPSSFITHHSPAPLPPMSAAEEVLADYRTAGLSLRGHPLAFLRGELAKRNIVPAQSLATLPDGKPLSVAGIVLVRQRPGTAKGITFITLEDETGTANLIVRLSVWKRYRQAALGSTVLMAHGRLQRQGQVVHLLATRLEDLSPWLEQLGSQSRNFR
jgi:error-prone DNA polymerase